MFTLLPKLELVEMLKVERCPELSEFVLVSPGAATMFAGRAGAVWAFAASVEARATHHARSTAMTRLFMSSLPDLFDLSAVAHGLSAGVTCDSCNFDSEEVSPRLLSQRRIMPSSYVKRPGLQDLQACFVGGLRTRPNLQQFLREIRRSTPALVSRICSILFLHKGLSWWCRI